MDERPIEESDALAERGGAGHPASAAAPLERDAELEQLDRLAAMAARGEGAVVVIEGPAGIGKTTLLRELRHRAKSAGIAVLAAWGSELEREFGFGVVRQLFEPTLATLAPPERDEVMAGAADLAGAVLAPAGSTPAAEPSTGSRQAALHGLYWLCANLAERAPLLLAIDDAHWGDRPSLAFLEYLARRLEGLPVLVAVAARTGEPGAGLKPLRDLVRATDATVLSPAALSPAAVRALARAALGPEVGDDVLAACHEASGGNAFLLRELLAELAERVELGLELSARDVPRIEARGIAALVAGRLATIGGAAPALARALAVLGDGTELRHLATLAGVPVATAGAAADALAAAAILAPGRPPGFLHPLLRAAVYGDLGESERASAHAHAARLLAAAAEPPETVASHLLLAEPEGLPWVVDALRAAARTSLARGAPEVAAPYLRRALAEPPTPAERASLRVELGRALALAGRTDAAAVLGEALELADDPGTRAWAAVELGQVLSYEGDVETAAATVRRALEGAQGRRELERPLQMMLLVMAETALAGREAAGDLLRRAGEAVERLGDDAPRGLFAVIAFERAVATGTAAEAGTLAELALTGGRLLPEQGPESPHAVFAAGALSLADRYEEAERALGETIADAGRRGSTRGYALASAARAWTRYRGGDLRGAEDDAVAALDLVREAGWELFRPQAAAALANAFVERGNLTEAAATLSALDARPAESGSLHAPLLREARAHLHLARGEAAKALLELMACATWEEKWGARNSTWVQWRPQAALAHSMLGEEDARRLAEEGLAVARRFGAPRGLGIALRSLGLIEGGERGVELLRETVSTLAPSGARLEHARALVDLGAALRRAGARREARERLAAGMDLAHRCGASSLAERGREELVTAGARPRRLARTGLEALTAGERRVARLAVEGLTNKEIAQALFVTARTVEMHLGNAYRKLEISSRKELPAELASTG